VADVRRFPGSRRHPHFSRERFEPLLAAKDIGYLWLPELGGRRTPRKDSPNTGWRVAAFRGYADYMETPEFESALARLLDFAAERSVAVMCAEAVWWQCHRRLIADALAIRGHDVVHIQTRDRAAPHVIAPPASIRDGRLSYAASQLELGSPEEPR
jgi:uncharacterized protein (DUF488 family)